MQNKTLKSYKGHNIILDCLGYIWIEKYPVCIGNKNNLEKAIKDSKKKIENLISKNYF